MENSVFGMINQRTSILLLLGVTATVVGCGPLYPGAALTTGANLKPTVTFKPSKASGGAEGAAAASTADEAVASEGVGVLRGKVEFVGSFTVLPPLYAKGADVKDAATCSAVEAPNEDILVKDGGLANVFIYLKKAPKTVPPPTIDASFVFDQKGCVFKPHAMITRAGQTIRVLNGDDVAHNTHTYGKKTTTFNSIVNPNDRTGAELKYTLAEMEPISVGCDIHPWMKAYHLPLDHPYAALSGEDGKFEIKDLPAGKHEFKVWHEVGKLIEKSLIVTIKPGDNDLTIKVNASQLVK